MRGRRCSLMVQVHRGAVFDATPEHRRASPRGLGCRSRSRRQWGPAPRFREICDECCRRRAMGEKHPREGEDVVLRCCDGCGRRR